jgi:hypothetical protein
LFASITPGEFAVGVVCDRAYFIDSRKGSRS